MIFHTPDKSFKRLSSCWKRASSFSQKGIVDPNHPLAAAWSNTKLACDSHLETLIMLDWFALKLNEHAKTHVISGDDSVAAILYEFKMMCFIDPTKLA